MDHLYHGYVSHSQRVYKKSDFTNQSQSMLLSNDLSIFRIIETRKIQSIYALVNKHSF